MSDEKTTLHGKQKVGSPSSCSARQLSELIVEMDKAANIFAPNFHNLARNMAISVRLLGEYGALLANGAGEEGWQEAIRDLLCDLSGNDGSGIDGGCCDGTPLAVTLEEIRQAWALSMPPTERHWDALMGIIDLEIRSVERDLAKEESEDAVDVSLMRSASLGAWEALRGIRKEAKGVSADCVLLNQHEIEIGEKGTRTEGMVRTNGGPWKTRDNGGDAI